MNRPIGVWVFTVVLILGAGSSAFASDPLGRTMDMGGILDGPVMLNSPWQTAWGRLLDPGAPDWATETGTFSFPGLWQPGQEGMQAKGCATFRLTLTHLPREPVQAALYIPDIFSVGRVWINGQPRAQTGLPGYDRASEKPGTHSLIVFFTISSPTLDILIQVSNFHNARGGINHAVWFGPAGAVQNMVNQKQIFTTVISAAFLMIALVHLTLFFIGKTGTVHAWFGLYALTWAVQTLFSPAGGSPGNLAARGLPWCLPIDLTLTACAVGPPLLIMCYHTLFPHPWGKRINRIFQAAALVFFIYILLPPAKAFDPVCLAYFFFTLAGFVYLFIRLILDLMGRRSGAALLLPGFSILILTVINDILEDSHLIRGHSTFLGLLAFILSYSACISLRLSRTFAQVRNLSCALEQKDMELSELNRLNTHLIAKTFHEGAPSVSPEELIPVPGAKDPGDKDEEKKAQLVRVMNLSLDLWTTVTRTTRVELAEQSGLWNVYIGKDGWIRTQTLDKYLDTTSLPRRPRWKTVVKTADFVLAACDGKDRAMCRELREALNQFRHWG